MEPDFSGGYEVIEDDLSFKREKPIVQVTDETPDFSGGFEVVEDTSTQEDTGFSLSIPKLNKAQSFISDREEYTKQLEQEELDIEAENQMLLKQRTAHRKKDVSSTIGDLEEGVLPSFLTGSTYTKESVSNYMNKLKSQGVQDNQLLLKLKEAGVSDYDTRAAQQYRDGMTSEPTLTGFMDFIGGVTDIGEEVILDPLLSGLGKVGIGIAKLSEYVPNIANSISPESSTNMAKSLERARAYLSAVDEQYKKKFGAYSFVEGIGANSLDIATAGYNPTSLMKLAIVGSAAAGTTSLGQGFDGLQAAAHASMVAGATGLIAGVIKVSDSIYNPVTKSFNKSVEATKQLKYLASRMGYSEEQMSSIIKAYQDTKVLGTANPEDIISDAVKYIAQSHPDAKKGVLGIQDTVEHLLLRNPQYSEKINKEVTQRADEVVKHVAKNSDLGKLIHKHTRVGGEYKAVDWNGLLNSIKEFGTTTPTTARGASPLFKMDTPIISKIATNAKVYGDSDMALHLFSDANNLAAKIGETKMDAAIRLGEGVAQNILAKEAGNIVGTTPIPKLGPFQEMAKVALSGIKSLARKFTGAHKLEQFLKKQYSSGKNFNATSLAEDMRLDPKFKDMSDDEIDNIVEDIIKQGQNTPATKLELRKKEHKANVDAEITALNRELAQARSAYKEAKANVAKAKSDIRDGTGTMDDLKLAKAEALDASDNLTILDDEIYRRTLSVKDTPVGGDVTGHRVTIEPSNTVSPRGRDIEYTSDSMPYTSENKYTSTEDLPPMKLDDISTSRLDRKMQTIKQGRGGKVSGRVSQRMARREYLPRVFGKKFAEEFEKFHLGAKNTSVDDAISNYIISKAPPTKDTHSRVSKYYEINPSFIKYEDGTWGFGVPKVIRDKFGIDYNKVDVPEEVLKKAEKIANGRDGFISLETIGSLAGSGTSMGVESIAKKDLNGDGKFDHKDMLMAGIGGAVAVKAGPSIMKYGKGTIASKDITVDSMVNHLKSKRAMIVRQGGKDISIEVKDGVISVDTSRLVKGSGEGGKFYHKLFEAADKLGYKYSPAGLSNKDIAIRVPYHLNKYYKETGKLPLVGGKEELNKLMRNAKQLQEAK